LARARGHSAERQAEIICRRIVMIPRMSVTEGSAAPGRDQWCKRRLVAMEPNLRFPDINAPGY
jgi:hypothetical protein